MPSDPTQCRWTPSCSLPAIVATVIHPRPSNGGNRVFLAKTATTTNRRPLSPKLGPPDNKPAWCGFLDSRPFTQSVWNPPWEVLGRLLDAVPDISESTDRAETLRHGSADAKSRTVSATPVRMKPHAILGTVVSLRECELGSPPHRSSPMNPTNAL